MKILLVDDHALFREGLKSLLNHQSDFTVIGEAGTVREAIEQSQELKPELVLMAANLADGDAAEAIQQIRMVSEEIKVVILTQESSEELFLAAIRNGAVGFLLKNISISNLIASLHALARGESLIPRELESPLVREFQRLANTWNDGQIQLDVLSPRELQIFGLVGGDATYEEIAEDLAISINTVKVHVHHIYEKLNFRDHRALKHYAKRYIGG
jgi:DNA-binding NarL/FixJ family response regulator